MSFHHSPATFVEEVAINVTNLERAKNFYVTILGFSVLTKDKNEVQLTADGKTSLLKLIEPEGVQPRQPRTTGLYHFAILLPSRADLASIIEHLAAHDIQLGASDHLVSEALYFNDPDGNGIEVYRDRAKEEWNWHNQEVKMTVDPLDFEEVMAVPHDAWIKLPEETKMGHIHLHVSDLSEAEDFYGKLGFEAVCRYGQQALFISTEGYHHHIGLNIWNGAGAPAPSEKAAGLVQYTLVFPNEETLLQAAEKTGAAQVAGGWFIKDPSQNGIFLKTASE
ncbi:VOC family protein [Jeotgalibacillus salarius]|uniref:VOC family protein n=1 Tax=Jeotgalibacillus salarius TaxID=546023 RepID=A0A4Y8LHL5_9BACL|nr:VOC family protein [Jeotgalibacillus salarius]TFE02224.1 VOC family protein [Jeotgalibacillus salarius]